MKIIKGEEFANSLRIWWVGRLIECEYCKTLLNLEAGDPVEAFEDAKSPEHDMVQFGCPTCRQRIAHCRNSPQGKKPLEENPTVGAIDSQPEAVEKLGMPTGKSYEYRTYNLGVEALILNATTQAPNMEQSWGDVGSLKSGFSWKWSAITAAIIFSGVALTVALPKLLPKTLPSKVTVLKVADTKTEQEKNLEASKQMERVTAALQGYFSAKTIEEMSLHVRLPNRVRPMMENYYAKQPLLSNPIVGETPDLEPLLSPAGRDFWLAKCKFKNGQNKDVVVEILRNGEAKVDWENATGYEIMGLDEFADQQPRELSLDFRVSLEYDSYYADEFSDEKLWRCFKLSSPKNTSIIYGYVKADSPLLAEIEGLIHRSADEPCLTILQLKFPMEFKAKRGVVIEKIVSPVWLYLE